MVHSLIMQTTTLETRYEMVHGRQVRIDFWHDAADHMSPHDRVSARAVMLLTERLEKIEINTSPRYVSPKGTVRASEAVEAAKVACRDECVGRIASDLFNRGIVVATDDE
jgi:hypothetical protein